jgi:predicted O-methyltransferase YrrM
VEIINSGKEIEFCCIDPWLDGGPDLKDTEWYRNLPEHVRADLFKQFLHNTRPVASVIKPLKMTSLDASALFEDQSIDFLMLDGDHNYPAVKQDIQAWLPKMKKGGMLSGDDYRWPGVTQSVEETIGHNHIGVRDVRKDKNYLLSASYWFYRVK